GWEILRIEGRDRTVAEAEYEAESDDLGDRREEEAARVDKVEIRDSEDQEHAGGNQQDRLICTKTPSSSPASTAAMTVSASALPQIPGSRALPAPRNDSVVGRRYTNFTFFSGRLRTGLPVAAKMALSTAGATTLIVGSPTPPQKS